jgi:hypothetical protein
MTVGFHPYISTAEREVIVTATAPLVSAGYQVLVEPAETTPAFGWDISLDRPGRHACFRMKVGASSVEWAQAVARFLDAAHLERNEARHAP